MKPPKLTQTLKKKVGRPKEDISALNSQNIPKVAPPIISKTPTKLSRKLIQPKLGMNSVKSKDSGISVMTDLHM